MSFVPDASGVHILEPQLRRTSEIRYHSDLAPGQRFVFVGRVVDPICRLYIVGRRVDRVPADQPEWLDDHRHNCPTFYVLIGQNPDLTGLTAEIVIEGRRFVAESPSAIMLPTGFLHHHRLTAGGGWSFHVNVRSDYEESLMEIGPGEMRHARDVEADQLYRRTQRDAMSALRWEIGDGAIVPDETGSPQDAETTPTLWTFIDPDQFAAPGVRLFAQQLSSRTRGWTEAMHRHTTDEVTVVLARGAEPLHLGAEPAVACATPAKPDIVRAPASLYVPAGIGHRCRHVSGGRSCAEVLEAGVVTREVDVLTDPGEARGADWVLVATKAYQTAAAQPWLRRLCGPGTRVAVLQNGVEHEQRVAPLAPGAEVLPAVPYCDVTAEAPGQIVHRAGGSLVVPDRPAGRDLQRLFEGTAATIVPTDDFITAAWTKLCRNVSANAITALTCQRQRVVQRPDVTWLAMGLVAECIEVGRRVGAEFGAAGPGEVVDLRTFAPDSPTSMLEDRLAGRPLEYDALNGAVVRFGERYGIPTPLNRAVAALLAAISDAAPTGAPPLPGAGTSR